MGELGQGPKVDPVFKYPVTSFTADHIVPIREIVQMPGFDKLTEAQQLEVVNLKENIMGLGKPTNSSKQDKDWCEYQGHPVYGPVPPEVRKEMLAREAQARQAIQDAINQRVQLNESKAAAAQQQQGGGATSGTGAGQGSQQ